MDSQSAALLRRLNPFCAQALEAAASLCQTRAHAEILPEHWLLKLLEQGEGDLTVLARRYEWDMDMLSVKGCEAELDVLAFEGDEALSRARHTHATAAGCAAAADVLTTSFACRHAAAVISSGATRARLEYCLRSTAGGAGAGAVAGTGGFVISTVATST